MKNNYTISTSSHDMDLDLIHSFLKDSYWAKGISKAVVEKSIRNSLCFGLFDAQGAQLGFARMITDRATFAYLADVFVLPSYRGQGLSKIMMQHIVSHPDLQGLRRLMLATSDAHGLYKKFGFEPLNQPDLFMEKWDPEVYQT